MQSPRSLFVPAVLAGNAVLALGWFWDGLPTFGFLPVAWAFVAASAAAVLVSLAGRPPRPALVAAAFGSAAD